jgi:hypothetical protein
MNIYTQAKLIQVFVFILVLGQLAFFVLAWTNMPLTLGGVAMQFTPSHISFEEMQQMSVVLHGVGVVIALPEILLLAAGFWFLHQFLSRFQQDSLFSLTNTRLLRNFAACLLLSIVWSILEPIVRVLVFKWFSQVSTNHYAMGVSSAELSLLLMVGLFFLIINIMHEGRKLEEENEAFI